MLTHCLHSLNQRFRRLNLFGNIPTSDQSVGAAFAGAPHMDPTVENLRNTYVPHPFLDPSFAK